MALTLTKRQEAIVFQALINYEYEHKKITLEAQMNHMYEDEERYQKYVDEIHEVLLKLDTKGILI